MNNRVIQVFIGIFFGFVAQGIGFVLYWKWFTRENYWDLMYFYETVFVNLNAVQVGTFSILTAMLLFYFFNRKQQEYMARGVVVSIIIGVVYLISKTF